LRVRLRDDASQENKCAGQWTKKRTKSVEAH
jgi:hypothetical protein